jgi:DNA-binding response OmpR family regulator
MPQALVVEDDEGLRTYLAAVLVHHGLDVLSASSGEEALALLGTGRVDVAVLDVGLPGMSGFDVADALGETPVIIVTGDPVGAYAQAYARRGLDYRVLPKPLAPDVFEHALDEVLAVV